MRIALAGKGGAGKTTIAATLARLLVAQMPVVAVDADSNPNLATALGIRNGGQSQADGLPHRLVSRRQGGPALTEPLDAVLADHAVATADGVRLVLMGSPAHAGEGCLCSAHATISALLADLGDHPEVAAVIDMEASPEHLSRGTARNVDSLLLITEPYYRSLEAARRLADLARELPIAGIGVVANKVRTPDDLAAISEFCHRHDLSLVAAVPRSEAVVDADVARIPLLDQARAGRGGEDVVTAVDALARHVLSAVAGMAR